MPELLAGDGGRGHRHRAPALVAVEVTAVHLQQEVERAVALPGVAALVGAVADVVAVHVVEQAVLGVGLEVLGYAAVALDAGAHAHGGSRLQAAGDVGLGRGARVLAQEHVVGAAALAARVALDDALAGELQVVAVPHEHAAALVVAGAGAAAAVVAGDGAAVDGGAVVAHVDAAALVLAGVVLDGAVLDGDVLLVDLKAAAVVVGVVAFDDYVLYQAGPGLTPFGISNMDAAAALVVLIRYPARPRSRVRGNVARAVSGQLEAVLVEVDASAGGSCVAIDTGVVG